MLRRKVTPMAKRTRKRPVVFTIWASVSFAAYCKMFNTLAVYRLQITPLQKREVEMFICEKDNCIFLIM